jgi:polar amino acid transport system substrate-binding protein
MRSAKQAWGRFEMRARTYAKAARALAMGALIGLAGAWSEARAQQTPGSATPPGTAVGEVVERPAAIDVITATGVIRIGVPDDLPPFGAPGADGRLEGYDIDVANLLAKELGVRAELRPLKSGNRVASLLAHEVDLVVANLGVNPERAKGIAFSTPYAPFFSGVFGAPGIAAAGPAELQGKRIAVTRNSLEDKELSAMGAQGVEILRFDDNKATLDAYLAGQADLVATGNVVIADLVKRQPEKPIERKLVIRESPASIGVPRDQPHLLNWVNVFIFHKKLTGELDALARKWFGEPLPPLPIL